MVATPRPLQRASIWALTIRDENLYSVETLAGTLKHFDDLLKEYADLPPANTKPLRMARNVVARELNRRGSVQALLETEETLMLAKVKAKVLSMLPARAREVSRSLSPKQAKHLGQAVLELQLSGVMFLDQDQIWQRVEQAQAG
jgi:hypothetical protein